MRNHEALVFQGQIDGQGRADGRFTAWVQLSVRLAKTIAPAQYPDRSPGESRDLLIRPRDAEKWVPAFAGTAAFADQTAWVGRSSYPPKILRMKAVRAVAAAIMNGPSWPARTKRTPISI